MPINSFPIQTKNVTGLPPVVSSSNTKLIVVSGTGAYLLDASSFVGGAAGVNMVNGLSGNLLLTGTGNITISNNSNTLIISGNTGAYANFITPSQTGLLTGTFVLRSETGGFGGGSSTPAGVTTLGATGITNTGFFTGNILISGAGNVVASTGNNISKLIVVSGDTGAYSNFLTPSSTGNFITNGMTGILTGEFVRRNESGQFAASGNLTATGINLQGQLNTITTWTGTTPNIFASITHGHNYVTSLAATGTTNTGFFTGDAMLSGAGNIVVSTGTPINKLLVISGNTGAYANFVTLGQTGGLVSSANTGNFVTTGQTGLLINVFYPLNSNPSNYLTPSTVGGVRTLTTTGFFPSGIVSGNVAISGISIISVTTGAAGQIVISGNTGMFDNFTTDSELLSASGYLVNLISASSAGVSSLNGQSGVLNILGSGNVTIFTGAGFITVSGNTGAYANFLTPSTVGGVRTLQTTGTNPSGIVSGNVVLSGAGNTSVFTGANGVIIISGTGGGGQSSFAGVSSIAATGITNTGFFTGDVLFSGAGNTVISTGTPINKLIVVSGNTGAYANFVTLSQTGNVVNTSQTGGFASIQVTGSPLLPLVNLTGVGNVIISTGASPLVIVSGNTGAYANFVTLSQTGGLVSSANTGSFVTTGQTGSLTNVFYPLNSNPSSYLTSATVGGVRAIVPTGTSRSGMVSGNVIFTGAGNVTVETGISGIVIVSGNTGSLTNAFYPLNQNPSGYVQGQTGTGILDGQLLIGASGINGFQQGDLYGLTGIIVVSGSGSLGVGIDVSKVVTGLVAGTNISVSNNSTGLWTINATSSTIITTTGAYPSGTVSGNVILTGAGNVSVFTGISGRVVISGNTGAYANFITPSQTGLLTGQFYPLSLNPAGYLTAASAGGVNFIIATGTYPSGNLSGNVYVSGAGGITVLTGANNSIIVSGSLIGGSNAGSFSGLHKVWVPAAAMTPSQITGATTGQIFTAESGHTIDVLQFTSGSGQSAYFNLSFPKVWDRASVVPVLYWTTTGNVGTINWGIAAANIDDGSPLNIQYNQGATITDSTISGNYLHQTTGAPLIISGSLTDDDQCYFKIYRSAGGTLADEGKLIGIGLAYTETGLSSSNAVGVNTIGATGIINTGYFTGDVLLSGAGNVVAFTGDNANKLMVISGDTGAYANFAFKSETGTFVTTGSTGLLTNVFYPLSSNPANYLTVSSQVGVRAIIPTGTTNSGQISGNVIITGAGNVTTFTGISGHIVISGNTGAYANFVTLSQTGNVVNTSQTGGFNSIKVTGSPLLPLVNLTGAGNVVVSTGINSLVIVSGDTGAYSVFAFKSDTGSFLTSNTVGGVRTIQSTGAYPSGFVSGNVVISGISTIGVTTGAAGQIVISGDTGAYAVFALKSDTGQFITAAQTGNFVTTGQTGLLTNVFYPLTSNPSNYLTVSNEVGVRRIIPTGTTNSGSISGNIILTGAGNVTTSTGISGHIVISGNTGAYANFVTLSQTGNVVNTSQTGGFASIQVTGSPLLPLVNLTGAGNVTVVTGANPLVIVSGNTGAYANFVSLSQTGGFLTATSLNSYMLVTGERNDTFAPLNIQFTLVKTGLVFTNTGSFRIYTVPNNLFLAPDSFELITKNVSGITTGAAFGVGSGTGFTSEFVSGYRMENTGTWGRGNFDMYTDIITGGQNINFNIYTGTTGASNTTHSGYFILRGTLYSGI
jgi:hypothetical protein